jgi:hypothetical protein
MIRCLVLVLLMASSCTHSKKNLLQTHFRLSIESLFHDFDNNQDQDFSLVSFPEAEVYVSNFLRIAPDQADKFIEKRKSSFLRLFQDDIDPYTLRKTKRRECLVKVDSHQIEFVPGEGKLWSDCKLSSKQAPQVAVRYWKVCHSTLWEITIKSKQPIDITFKCDE